jgi:spermidine synthase
MTQEPPVTLARAMTARGEIALRRRGTGPGAVHELVVAGIFAMDSVDVTTEVALARRVLAGVTRPARVLVGGLGLGHTALAVLEDPRVRRLDVAELEPDLLAWARAGLVPSLAAVTADPRVRLVTGDVAGLLTEGGGVQDRYDAILLDVDNGPSFLVHPHNARLYAADHLRATLARLAPGGVLGIWAAQREPALLDRLRDLAGGAGWPAGSVTEVVIPVARESHRFDYALYLATAAS